MTTNEKAEGTVRRSLLADENDELPNADVLGAATKGANLTALRFQCDTRDVLLRRKDITAIEFMLLAAGLPRPEVTWRT